MNRVLAACIAIVLTTLAVAQSSSPASATTAWTVAQGRFSISDGFGATLSITVQGLKITDAGAATGYVLVAWDRYSCTTQTFTDSSAAFFPRMYEPCDGTISFAVDPATGVVSASGALSMTSRYFYGNATGTAQAVPDTPVVITLQDCKATADSATQTMGLTWTDDPTATGYNVSVPGFGSVPVTGANAPRATVPFAALSPGATFTATITGTNTAGAVVASCTTNALIVPWPTPGAPAIVGTPIPAAGGQVTVNYAVSDPTTVLGIEYQIDSGPWTRPGGTAPTGGVGGSFTVGNLAVGRHTIVLRSVGLGPAQPTTQGAATDVVIPAPVKPQGTGQTAPPVSIGSTPQAPAAAPPAKPVSTVAGTSNGAGRGTNGALAASTGDAGVDAPCFAKDGTLYPTLYSTVGSQLTMAPNTNGMGEAISFTVIEGALPVGMSLDRRFGVVYGVTTQAGSWTTTVRAQFADGSTKDGRFGTRVDSDPQRLQYPAQNIGAVGLGISIAPSTNAPISGTTYSLICGTLPPGTRLDTSTGRITGSPTAAVERPIPLRIAESSQAGTASASFIVVVDQAGTRHLSYPSHPHARPGMRVAIRPTVSGIGDVIEFRTWKGELPPGLHLNHTTGVITGRVRHAGPPHTITLVAETQGGALLTASPMKVITKR